MLGDRLKDYAKKLLHKEVCQRSPKISLPQLKSTLPAHTIPMRFLKKSQETVIAEDVTLTGSLKFDRLLRINGSFEGKILSNGKIIVGPKGTLKSQVFIDSIEVEGRFIGDLSAGHAIIRTGAIVEGNLHAKSLVIEAGAQICGRISIENSEQLKKVGSAS